MKFNQFFKVKLGEVLESILHISNQENLDYRTKKDGEKYKCDKKKCVTQNLITSDDLVIGAVESAFLQFVSLVILIV